MEKLVQFSASGIRAVESLPITLNMPIKTRSRFGFSVFCIEIDQNATNSPTKTNFSPSPDKPVSLMVWTVFF